MSHQKEYLQLHFIVILWGFTAVLGLLIKMPVLEMVFLRTAISSIALAIIVKGKRLDLIFNKKELILVIITGFFFAGHWLLFFGSARVANASVALVGYATATFWVSIIEPFANKSRIRILEVILGVIVLAGIYIIFRSDFDSILGLIMAIGCGLLAGLYAILNKRLTPNHNHLSLTFIEMTAAALAIGIFLPIYSNLLKPDYHINLIPTLSDLGYLLILSLLCTVYAVSASIKIMKKLSAYVVSLSLNMEPVYGIILALIIFGDSEKMNPGFYLGSAIIILSVLGYPLLNRTKKIT